MIKRTLFGAAIVAASLSALASSAGATNLLGSTTSATISGTTFGFGPSAMPWTAEVYSPAGGCLRVAVTSQGTDLKATVVAPNGTVYRDDDSGGSNRPLVRINGTPNNGWYTVSINNWNGAAVSQNFTVTLQRLGRWCWLPAGNRADGRGHGVGGRQIRCPGGRAKGRRRGQLRPD